MRAVRAEVATLPGEAVGARRRAVRPEVRPPTGPRPAAVARLERGHASLDRPLDGEAGGIGVRLRVERRRRVAAVRPAGQVDDGEIREPLSQYAEDALQLAGE